MKTVSYSDDKEEVEIQIDSAEEYGGITTIKVGLWEFVIKNYGTEVSVFDMDGEKPRLAAWAELS
jgi:hypothetical protein